MSISSQYKPLIRIDELPTTLEVGDFYDKMLKFFPSRLVTDLDIPILPHYERWMGDKSHKTILNKEI